MADDSITRRQARYLPLPARVERLEDLMEVVMSEEQQVQDAQAAVDAKLTQIKTDVEALVTKVGTLDPAAAAALATELAALQATLGVETVVEGEANPAPPPVP